MKPIITLIFLWTLLSCTGKSGILCESSGAEYSISSDARCDIIMEKASAEAKASGFCYVGPLLKGRDPGAIDPDPEKCSAIYKEAQKKCDALPPPKPEDINQLSGSAIYHKGKPVMRDGKPVCP